MSSQGKHLEKQQLAQYKIRNGDLFQESKRKDTEFESLHQRTVRAVTQQIMSGANTDRPSHNKHETQLESIDEKRPIKTLSTQDLNLSSSSSESSSDGTSSRVPLSELVSKIDDTPKPPPPAPIRKVIHSVLKSEDIGLDKYQLRNRDKKPTDTADIRNLDILNYKMVKKAERETNELRSQREVKELVQKVENIVMGKRGEAQHRSEMERIDALTSKFSKEENELLNEHLLDRIMGIGDGVIDDDARAKRLLRKEIDKKYSIISIKKEKALAEADKSGLQK